MRVDNAQKAAWTGLGLSAGSTMVLAGGLGLQGLDAVNRYQGQRDKFAADRQGPAVGRSGGWWTRFFGHRCPFIIEHARAPANDAESVTFGWISVGAWAAGVGTYFAAQTTGSSNLDWTWLALRGASFGTGLTQLLQTHQSIQTGAKASVPPPRRTVRLVVGPSGGAVVGTF